jgi:hypothetical protein
VLRCELFQVTNRVERPKNAEGLLSLVASDGFAYKDKHDIPFLARLIKDGMRSITVILSWNWCTDCHALGVSFADVFNLSKVSMVIQLGFTAITART